jgi:hypothetical protein
MVKHNRALIAKYLNPMSDRRSTGIRHTQHSRDPTFEFANNVTLVRGGDWAWRAMAILSLCNIGRSLCPYAAQGALGNSASVIGHVAEPVNQHSAALFGIATPRPNSLWIESAGGLPRHYDAPYGANFSGIDQLD